MKLKNGHEIHPVEGEDLKKLLKDFKGYEEEGLIRLNPGRWLYPSRFQNFADKIYTYKFRSTDVVVMTYPKCGTNWTQEIVWTMKKNPNLDNPLAHTNIMARSPFFEADMLGPKTKPGEPLPKHPVVDAFLKQCPGKDPLDGLHLQLTDASPDPRVIKTHLPFSLLSPTLLDTAKVVYTARNPKDVIVSYHHHHRIVKTHGYIGNLDDFVQYFVDDDLLYGPYWLHLKEAWENRTHPNLHFIFYENLKANPLGELKRLNTFLNTNLSDKQLKEIVDYTAFGVMKTRAEANMNLEASASVFNVDVIKNEGGFYRKGESGDWKGKLTPDMEVKVDQWIKKYISPIGLDFKYEAILN